MARRLKPVKQSHGSGCQCPCRIQLSPTSCTWILPGRAVASADKLLYETRSSDGASALPSRCTGYGTAGAHEESECGRGDLCGGGGDECIRCKDLSSRLSRTTRKLLGWTRRVGIGAAASGRMLCPNRANALEK
uniref:Uncharacterized protein n=1 Tax=Triticum urartu TaxID=4572 RepID=A0A8R7PWE3_TRIUA